MARVILVFGEPGNGKSFLATIFKSKGLADAILRTDEIYLGYIFTRKNTLYKVNLREDIAGHYNEHKGQLQGEWHEHLFEVVSKDAARNQILVVEGWQLFDCLDDLSRNLTKKGHKVEHILAVNKNYARTLGNRMELSKLIEWAETDLVPREPPAS